jgi:hypothetical protein
MKLVNFRTIFHRRPNLNIAIGAAENAPWDALMLQLIDCLLKINL